MLIFQDTQIASPQACPYLDDRLSRNEFFLAKSVAADELDHLLAQGWRRFAYYYFRPHCRHCQACIPLRIDSQQVRWSKSQRRLLNKNAHIQVKVKEKNYHPDIFKIYQSHSQRFSNNDTDDEQQFILTHFQIPVTAYRWSIYKIPSLP